MPNPAGQTAFGPMMIAAVEQFYPQGQRLLDDNLAGRFLPAPLRAVIELARLAPVRNLLVKLADRKSAGVWMEVLCRKRFIDDRLREALEDGVEAVLNLGAGLDTRAYRLVPHGGIPVYEVDLPENMALKEQALRRVYGRVPPHVNLAPIDIARDDLGSALAARGCRLENRRFFIIWEGVTQYLSEDDVRKTFTLLTRAKPGSLLVFTYIVKDFIDGARRFGLEQLYRHYREETNIWQSGLDPARTAAFLDGFGWKELYQAGSQEFTTMYLKPAGRISPLMEIERVIVASKQPDTLLVTSHNAI